MKRLWLAALIVVVAGLVVFGILRDHGPGPRIEVQVRPRAVMSKSECRADARVYEGFPAPRPRICFLAGSSASFVATVTNTGDRAGWLLACRITAIGRSGRPIRHTDVPEMISGGFLGALQLAPGASSSFDWFLSGIAPERVARYSGSCSYREHLNGGFPG